MTVGRATQAAIEILLLPEPVARVTQQALELLQKPAPKARVTGQTLEVLRSVAGAPTTSPRRPVTILNLSG